MAKSQLKTDGRTITVRVPIAIRKRGGRKVVLALDGTMHESSKLYCQRVDNAMVKALARAFRWRELLESGTYSTVQEIAIKEKINVSYVSRVLRLTLLAPPIIETIVDGGHGPDMTLAKLMDRLPISWLDQRATIAP